MNSYNIEKAVIRYWADRSYLGVFINISRDIGLVIKGNASIYVEAPGPGATAERILYAAGTIETPTPGAGVEILRDDGVLRVIYRFDLIWI